MSKINIQKNIMSQINEGKVKMRPKIYFIAGSVLTFFGLVASVIFSVFFTSFIRFVLKSHGPMGNYRFIQLITSFPWFAVLLVFIGFIFGIWFLRKYDFSYKKNFWLIAFGFILAIILAGFILDVTGLDNLWLQRGSMKNIYKIKQGSGWKLKN